MNLTIQRLLAAAAGPGIPTSRSMTCLGTKALLSLATVLMLFSGTTQAQWLSGYQYRKSLPINAGVGAGTDYQVQVRVGESSGAAGFDLHVENHAQNFPNDIRFTNNGGTTELSHWLESTIGTTPNRTATFWVKVNDSLDSTQSILAYYSKSLGTSGSNGDTTFGFFDNFTGPGIDGAKWITDIATGWSVSGGELRGQNTSGRIRSQTAFSSNVILETKYRSVSRPSNGNMALGFYTSTSDSFGWLNHPGGDYMRENGSWTSIGNECNVPVIARMTARATQVDFYVYRQDTGAVWHNQVNRTNTVLNERIALGNRYDNGYTNQTYDAYWDWVRVRKYATTTPTLGTAGTEQSSTPLVTLTAPANGSQVVSNSSASATATVSSGKPPYTVNFYKNYNGTGPVLAGTATTEPYSINLGVLTDGPYTIYATVTDSDTVTATSATHSFTVAPDNTPPSPNPMTFDVNPVALSETSIRMVATTATDTASPAVEYFFKNITNNNESGWISSPMWTESGLTLGASYSYQVKARDSATSHNETSYSAVSSAAPGVPASRPITLVNPGFEIPTLTDGASTGIVWGWSRIGSGFYAWNPTSSNYPAEAPEGRNIGVVFLAPAYSGCSQVLQGTEGQFQADTTYELKVKVGGGCDFASVSRPYDGYVVQLVVNGAVIAQDDNSRPPAYGSFTTTSIKYTYNSALHASLVGYPMEIRLLTKGLGAGAGLVSFDDVQLTYSTSNPVANHGGPYRVSQGNPLTLNGSASIPSPGATITSYEWDLDSRNDNLGFTPNLTGATPTSIPYATLTGTYGMVEGPNTIRLRITDNSGQTTIGTTTVLIYTLYTYTGPANPRGQDDNWNKTVNWDAKAVPSGLVDVMIPASKFVPCVSSVTPTYSGNLTIGTNSQISCGWGSEGTAVYNAMGTPGQTVITMNTGSSLNFRIGGTPIIPGITLAGNASVTLGSSTAGGAQASFNYPITGSSRLSLYGNGPGSCVANFNAPNTFNEIYTAGAPYSDGGVTIQGNVPGSLGPGNLTLTALTGGGNSGLLVINAANAMADGATLSMDGNTATKITMNANDTIARLVINGAQMPAGTYGSATSSATFKQTWIAGNAILTVTDGEASYWDINAATAGAGSATPTGTWDSGAAFWSNSTNGVAATASWVSGRKAIFAAGSDATGTYNVTVGGSNAITVTNSFTTSINTGTSGLNVTKAGWTLDGGNCVAVLVSALNATGFTASYAGQPMTVQGVYESRNSYTGIAYIISDSLPVTGDVVITVPRVMPAINTGAYGNMGTVYSIMSLSNVASAGTAVTKVQSSGNASLTYSTSVNNSFVLGVASDSNWQNSLKSVVGRCSTIITRAKPAYFNTIQCYGSIPASGSYTDVYSPSITVLITQPFNAKTASNPLLAGDGQKISGLEFEEGAVTVTGSKLELQTNSPFTSVSGVTATIASQISGLSSSGLLKKGPGTVILSNSTNNYAGSTSVLNGTLRLGASNALPNTGLIIAGDALGVTPILDLNGNNCTVSGLTLGGAFSTSGSTIITGAGTLTLSGNLDFASDNNPLGATISGNLDSTISGNLALGSDTRTFNIEDSSSAANDLTVFAVISGTGGISKTGFGTLLLSGDNAYTGLTTVSEGLLILSGSNSGATGGITVNPYAAVRFDTPASINGTGANVTINANGLASFGPSFNGTNIATALTNRINPASVGVIAADNYVGANFNFSGLNVYLGALNDVTYTGTLTPKAGEYRIGGGSGILTLAGANALTGSNSLLVGGRVVIANSNNLSGATTISSSGRLQLGAGGMTGSIASSSVTNNGMLVFNRSDDITQGTNFWPAISGSGIVEQSGSGVLVLNANNTYSGGTNMISGTLSLGHVNAIGSGPLNIYSGALDTASTLTLTSNNRITLWSSFSFVGTATLNMGTGPVSNFGNSTIILNGSNKELTFGGVMTNISGGDQILTVDGEGNTLVLGGYNLSSDKASSLVALTIGGSGNVSITGPVNDWTGGNPDTFTGNPGDEDYIGYDPYDIRLGTLTKTGTGTLKLSANNNYTGDTIVAGGVLHLHSGTQISPVTVNNGGTLAFTLNNTITSTETLTLNDGHKIRIVGLIDTEVISYTLMSAFTITGGSPTLETDIDGYVLEIAGNELRLSKEDTNAPLLLDIVNDMGAGPTVGPILPGTLVTYTVIFNEDIKDGSLTSADFTNAGTSDISFGTIMEISPGVFTVEVTPQAGTLLLRIQSDPDPLSPIEDNADNDLVVPITDDTTINVEPPNMRWLEDSDIVDDMNGAAISQNTLVTYTLYFSKDINLASVTSADFVNAGDSNITIGAIAEIAPGVITVQVTPTTVGTLQLSIHTDAEISDGSNNMDVDPAIVDDTPIDVLEPYSIWAQGDTFSDDTNGDGVPNGLAWLLGATDANQDAKALLPKPEVISGDLYLYFTTLNTTGRGTASIKVQYSRDMGSADLWTNHEAEVPGAAGTSTDNGIQFNIESLEGDYISVEARIPASAASPGTKLFSRVKGTSPTP